MPVINHTALLDIAGRIFTAAGSEPDEARTIADYLVEANLRGHDSHGVGLIPNYLQHLAGGTGRANRKGRVARKKGEQMKPGILLDGAGQPTTDPGAMYSQQRGALLTFGEHKGYALAFVCEMLAGALCGSGTMRPERQGRGTATNGMLTIVIDPSRLVDREWLHEEIAAMTAYITPSPPARPDDAVVVPCHPERPTRAYCL